ncbi:hypothetical protein ACODYM_29300 [Burkholderia gladioli]|uniref:hypothetical protein n=1 Tax=Burkholderia gladioli TaxID=28095 RepID=UPI003B509614
MPNPISVANVIEKNRLSSDIPYVLLMKVDLQDMATGSTVESLYFANCPDPVPWGGQTYAAAQFSIDLQQEAGEMPQLTLSALDYAQALIKPINQYGGGVGMPVTVTVINAGDTAGDPELQEFFEVISCEVSNYNVQFTLGAENGLAKTFPKRVQRRDFCTWVYRDPSTCAYVGSLTSCDRTLHGPNGCSAHANSINFGAYPSIAGQSATV